MPRGVGFRILNDLWILSRRNIDGFECSSTCFLGNRINNDCSTRNTERTRVVSKRQDVGKLIVNATIHNALKGNRCGLVVVCHCHGITESVHDGRLVRLNRAAERVEKESSFLKKSKLDTRSDRRSNYGCGHILRKMSTRIQCRMNGQGNASFPMSIICCHRNASIAEDSKNKGILWANGI